MTAAQSNSHSKHASETKFPLSACRDRGEHKASNCSSTTSLHSVVKSPKSVSGALGGGSYAKASTYQANFFKAMGKMQKQMQEKGRKLQRAAGDVGDQNPRSVLGRRGTHCVKMKKQCSWK